MNRLTNAQAQTLLKRLDDHYLALYQKINDPEPPRAPEPLGRVSRFLRPADLANAR